MNKQTHVSSRNYNTFQIDVSIHELYTLSSKLDFEQVPALIHEGYKILGGGSNILMSSDVKVPVFHVRNKGIEIVLEKEEYVLASIGAGENWHDVVMWAIDHDYGGIENLSLIPGNAGTAPIQNIGAYGVEIKDVLHSLKAFKVSDGLEYSFHNSECQFAYRDSIFKNVLKGKFIISEIILQLTKAGHHRINTSYGAIQSKLKEKAVVNPGISDVSEAVIEIRTAKLPDPSRIGNAGSFFKNPVIPVKQFEKLKLSYSDMPHYPVDDDFVKLPAGWLIDQCGWKGKIIGNTGTYKNQALVLVNHGGASGREILELSEKIMKSVYDTYNIHLEREVNVWF
ncbi:MAG: UDP-N-acetylmuramate dehydrogenase [Saprospiraceae bacterium]|nr:UDP-N-acetylmuramate dehydrogenase [Saprospiraceae bacterium]